MNIKYTFLLLLCAVFGIQLLAQEKLSLSDAIQKGLENNYQIQIANRDIEIAQNNNNWAVAGRYPRIDLTLNSDNNYRNTDNPASFLISSSSLSVGVTPGASLSWQVFDGYQAKFTKRQLEQIELQSQTSAKITVENTISTIILAYYQALIQEEQLEVLAEVLKLSRDRVDYENVRKEFGQATTFDILQTQDAYLNDSTSYLVQQTSFENALRSLNLAMGEDEVNKVYELTDRLNFDIPEYQISDLKDKLFASNNTLQNLYIGRELAAVNTKLQEVNNYPIVSLNTGINYNLGISFGNQTFLTGGENPIPEVAAKTFTGFFNLGLTYNLFDWGVRKTRIQNAKVGEIQSQLQIEDLKRSLSSQLENTYATFQNRKDALALTILLVDNAQRNLDIAEERFRGGLINSFDYRTIQLSYINANQSRLTAIFNLKTTETELIRLIGGLIR